MESTIINLAESNLDDYFEPTTVKAGEEYRLRIVNVIQGTDKNGMNYLMPFFEVVEEPYCKEFGDYMPLPDPSNMTPKDLNKAKLRLVSFFRAFDIEYHGDIPTDELQGKEGWAILGMGKDQDDAPVNKVNRYIQGA